MVFAGQSPRQKNSNMETYMTYIICPYLIFRIRTMWPICIYGHMWNFPGAENEIGTYLFLHNYFLSGILCGALLCCFVVCQVLEMWPNQRVVAFDKQQKLSNSRCRLSID